MKNSIKKAFSKFAYETFRPRSKDEYAEVFSRGNGGDGNTPYPWFYSRVFLVCLFLFSILCIGYSASGLNMLAVIFAGGILADFAFIVLLFELYPKRDIPLSVPLAALFAGGLLATAFAYILYGAFSEETPFASQAWTAFVEETSKAIATIIICKFVKKRNAYTYFIIGAAVGGGFSAFENMWYMQLTYELSPAIVTALIRALGTPFSHAAWAAAFGWALSVPKPWKKLRPYAVYLFNYLMHFFVNFPLIPLFEGWKGYPISAITGILTFVFLIFIIIKCRNEILPCEQISFISGKYTTELGNVDIPTVSHGYGCSKRKFIANIFAAVAVIAFSVMLMGPTCVFGGYESYKYDSYQTFEEAKAVMQCGIDFSPDFERAFVGDPKNQDKLYLNFSFTWTDGEAYSITQRQKYGEYYYRFRYAYNYYEIFKDEDGNLYVLEEGKKVIIKESDELGPNDETPKFARRWELQNISLEYEGELFGCITFYIYAPAEEPDTDGFQLKKMHYFNINKNCLALINKSGGTYEIMVPEETPVRALESIVFTSVFGAIFLGFGTAYLIEKILIRRNKDVK